MIDGLIYGDVPNSRCELGRFSEERDKVYFKILYLYLLVMDEKYRAMKSITGHYAEMEPNNYNSVNLHQ
jgi:hypothetical protein